MKLGFSTTFLGFFVRFFWIPLDTLIVKKSQKENRSQAYGFRTAAEGIGTIIGAILGFSFLDFTSSAGLSPFFAYGVKK